MPPINPKAPYWKILRPLFALLFVLLGLYLANGLLSGSIEYGDGGPRMSKNVNVIRLSTAFELLIGTIHFGALLFAFGAIAAKPEFFFKRKVLLPTASVLLVAHLVLIFMSLA